MIYVFLFSSSWRTNSPGIRAPMCSCMHMNSREKASRCHKRDINCSDRQRRLSAEEAILKRTIASSKILTAHRKFLGRWDLRDRGQTRLGEASAPRLDKGGENGERQRLVICFHGFIEAYG